MATRRGRREVGRPTLRGCITPARTKHRLGLEGASQKSPWTPTLLVLATVAVVTGLATPFRENIKELFGDDDDLHNIEAAPTNGNPNEQGSQTPEDKMRLSEMPDVNPGEEIGMDVDSGSVGE